MQMQDFDKCAYSNKAPEDLTYEQLVQQIDRAPKTYLPALLIHVAQVCEKKKVFNRGGLQRTVKRALDRLKQEEEAARL